jgi:hypothetical protein
LWISVSCMYAHLGSGCNVIFISWTK